MDFWTGFFVFLGLAAILWWALNNQLDIGSQAAHEHAAANDDLTKIEGIGPKTQDAFYAADMRTFAALAKATPAELDKLTKAAGLTAASEGSWPKQAKLAAAGDWDALKKLQDELTGGR